MPRPFFNNAHNRKLEEMIRVNHAGEFGAKRIYEGQIKYTTDLEDKKVLEHMLEQEQGHLSYFGEQIKNGFSRPTIFMPIWDMAGYLLGVISGRMGFDKAMLVTENVETVIESHYQEQIDYLQTNDQDNPLLAKIRQFREEEIEHKNIATSALYQNSRFIRLICKIAIFLSKKL